jgi:hypothetical protein
MKGRSLSQDDAIEEVDICRLLHLLYITGLNHLFVVEEHPLWRIGIN